MINRIGPQNPGNGGAKPSRNPVTKFVKDHPVFSPIIGCVLASPFGFLFLSNDAPDTGTKTGAVVTINASKKLSNFKYANMSDVELAKEVQKLEELIDKEHPKLLWEGIFKPREFEAMGPRMAIKPDFMTRIQSIAKSFEQGNQVGYKVSFPPEKDFETYASQKSRMLIILPDSKRFGNTQMSQEFQHKQFKMLKQLCSEFDIDKVFRAGTRSVNDKLCEAMSKKTAEQCFLESANAKLRYEFETKNNPNLPKALPMGLPSLTCKTWVRNILQAAVVNYKPSFDKFLSNIELYLKDQNSEEIIQRHLDYYRALITQQARKFGITLEDKLEPFSGAMVPVPSFFEKANPALASKIYQSFDARGEADKHRATLMNKYTSGISIAIIDEANINKALLQDLEESQGLGVVVLTGYNKKTVFVPIGRKNRR